MDSYEGDFINDNMDGSLNEYILYLSVLKDREFWNIKMVHGIGDALKWIIHMEEGYYYLKKKIL